MILSQVGEFGLINRFKRMLKTDASVIEGAGDDCAVLSYTKDKYLLYTSDMLTAGVDFLKTENPLLVGRKAVAVSLSDIAACGGIPRYALVSLGISPQASLDYALKIAKGMQAIAAKFKLNIVGGDICRMEQTTIDLSMIGIVERKNLVLRRGAKDGDVIFVSGALGGSILGKHLSFTPRVKEARFLVGNFKINSMIDISDGLSRDLFHILKASRKKAVIYEDLIPQDKKAKDLDDALYSGEDFELLFTASEKEAQKIILKAKSRFLPIGRIYQGLPGITLMDKMHRPQVLQPRGWQHF